jgi:glucuronosyltransferase
MKNLINGLVEFLLKTPNSFLLLVFGDSNYQTYQTVLNEMKNNEYLHILTDNQRVQIENRFVEQKWILQQNSIKLFLSHCGMGSCSEGIYFEKPILCMPFNMDQFINAISIEHLTIGLSLFVPPSLFQSFLDPHNFQDYNFSSNSVTTKLLKIWENDSYQKMIKIMSMEMKHAGGLKRAVEEIEFLVHLKGNLDRYAPFQSTLPFYQRYMLDLIIIFIILPITIVTYGLIKCRRRRPKIKND